MGQDEGAVLDIGTVDLGADQDLDPVQADEIGQEPGQVGLLLEALEEGLQLRHVEELGLVEELGGPLEDDPALRLLLVDVGPDQDGQLVR